MVQTIANHKLQNFYDSAYFTNIGMLTIVDELIADSINFVAGMLNSWISPTNHFEENAAVVNELYLTCCINGDCMFDSLQYATLYAIASENPYSGGDAVYKAREMIDEMFDDYLTEAGAKFSASHNTKLIKPEININPNPASAEVAITINAKLDKLDWSYKIYDVLGQLVLGKSTITNYTESINVSNLNKGPYFIHVNVLSCSEVIKKLINIK